MFGENGSLMLVVRNEKVITNRNKNLGMTFKINNEQKGKRKLTSQ